MAASPMPAVSARDEGPASPCSGDSRGHVLCCTMDVIGCKVRPALHQLCARRTGAEVGRSTPLMPAVGVSVRGAGSSRRAVEELLSHSDEPEIGSDHGHDSCEEPDGKRVEPEHLGEHAGFQHEVVEPDSDVVRGETIPSRVSQSVS